MNFKLRSLVATTLAGSFLMGFGVNAMADSTTDIVNALVAKGVLTEEEGDLLTKGHDLESAGQAKAMKKASKLKVSDAIDNATFYGDIRVRGEHREGNGVATIAAVAPTFNNNGTLKKAGTNASAVKDVDANRDRARYKLNFGVKTESGKFYTDLDLAMGAGGRSDNATFGKSATSLNDKESILVKRAMVGWNATDWLALEAGRMDNALYTTPMVWDADLTMEGLTEKVKYKVGDADLFLTGIQASYKGDRTYADANGTTAGTNATIEMFALQGGAKYAISDSASVKGAVTYTTYSHNTTHAVFKPGTSTDLLTGNNGVNDLDIIEVPAEFNWMASSNVGVRLFGDYVNNTSGNDRRDAAVAATSGAANKAKVDANDNTAWMLGVAVGSAKDLKAFEGNKMAKGDWSARMWYQDVGVYSIDQNAVDSDFMDSRVNMKGTVIKAQYNFEDNVFANFAYGHATRKNNDIATAVGSGNDLNLNLDSFDLVQLDLTYKF